MLDFMWPLWKV